MKKTIEIIIYLLALIFVIDFLLPGTEITGKAISIKQVRQNYYNAGGNSHFSYTLKCENEIFLISKEFRNKITEGDTIIIKKSKIFNEVNSYTFDNFSETFSLRLFSGLILPLLVIIIITTEKKFKLKNNTLSLIFKIMMIGNIIYVLLY
ncbi:hypothetical protein FBBAL38_09514 [Flavobacteria bacterium BAL38]|jgi:hypothetical protein|uniref:hypothetical protein n=1 Tax=unclassified Flavobacterium TaxID=196869 RepID=UPI0000F39184|nr:hypothetical protein [Flavobacterium sp. LMO8]EAZ95216.1 hypothetical protein FBBAL38_09514 [Flavobacteria bacterium BAL38]MDP5000744.1 hypothetical protein [Flavobacterium sp.]MDP5027124.1 hypothetical protein [Flavobacterium sp.]MQP25776.1 hypothetical protein [Flavobacterium sp. LMO8]